MEIFLSTNCQSFTGSLNKKLGYSIRQRGNRFFSQRTPKGSVPPDGHWRFILECTSIAQTGFLLSNISIHWTELFDALHEAHHFVAADSVYKNGTEAVKLTYNATDILNLKHTFGL